MRVGVGGGGLGKCLCCCCDEKGNKDDRLCCCELIMWKPWLPVSLFAAGAAKIELAEILALSSAKASQNALWVMKLSFLLI